MGMESTLQNMSHRVKAIANAIHKPEPLGLSRQDLLYRLFESEWFNEQMCLQYLFQSPQNAPGVEDYLCNKLYNMPEEAVERYLLQFVYLAVSNPGSALECTIVALCRKSFALAVKVHWLLLALSQDTTSSSKSRYAELLKDKCEKASLEGHWELPFKMTKLEPLEPMMSPEASVMSPILSPITLAPVSLTMGTSARLDQQCETFLATPGILHKIDESQEPGGSRSPRSGLLQSSIHSDSSPVPSCTDACSELQPGQLSFASPGEQDGPQHTCLSIQGGQAGESVLCGQPQQPYALQEHMRRIHDQLGDGEGVTALLHRSAGGAVAVAEDEGTLSDDDIVQGMPSFTTPLTPLTRLRRDTYGATLDFIETLCEASSSLVNISQEERLRALRLTLDGLNRELDKAIRQGIAVWFPMGKGNERVLRIAAKESVLLNSREKAPFMLFVEVLQSDDIPPPAATTSTLHTLPSPSPGLAPAPASDPQTHPPVPPGVSLGSLKGSLNSNLSPYLDGSKATGSSLATSTSPVGTPRGQASVDGDIHSGAPTEPAHGSQAGQTLASSSPCTRSASASVTCDGDVSVVGMDSPDGHASQGGVSQVPSTATSSGMPCSIATSAGTSMRLSAFAVPGLSLGPPGDAAVAPTDESLLSKAVTGPIAAALEAFGTVFKSKESVTQPPGTVANQPDTPMLMSQASGGSMQSVQEHVAPTIASSSSVVSCSSVHQLQPSGSSVVIPQRRRQTNEADQGGSGGPGGQPQASSSPALSASALLPVQGGITNAADEAAASGAGCQTSPGPGSLMGSGYSSVRSSFNGVAGPTALNTCSQGPVLTSSSSQPAATSATDNADKASSSSESSVWATALNFTRSLLPNSATNSSSSNVTPSASRPPLPPNAKATTAAWQAAQPGAVAVGETRPHGPLTQADVAELVSYGVIPAPQPANGQGPAGSIATQMAGVMASLRGEAPLVRLRLRVLPAAHQAEAEAAAAAAQQAALESLCGGSSASSGTSERAMPVAGGGQQQGVDVGGDGSGSGILASGSVKALNLLSKIGLCARPSLDEDSSPVAGRVAVTGAGTGQLPGPKLVAVSLEVANGFNLSITSPYRKSRRTPSHEAISMVATQLKISELPPPLELGPPLPDASILAASEWDAAQGLSTPTTLHLPTDSPQPLNAFTTTVASTANSSAVNFASTLTAATGGSFLGGSPRAPTPPSPAATSSSSPGLLRLIRTHSSHSSEPVVPHSKVGGLPMVGNVVSAAAAAAPGVLSPSPSATPEQIESPVASFSQPFLSSFFGFGSGSTTTTKATQATATSTSQPQPVPAAAAPTTSQHAAAPSATSSTAAAGEGVSAGAGESSGRLGAIVARHGREPTLGMLDIDVGDLTSPAVPIATEDIQQAHHVGPRGGVRHVSSPGLPPQPPGQGQLSRGSDTHLKSVSQPGSSQGSSGGQQQQHAQQQQGLAGTSPSSSSNLSGVNPMGWAAAVSNKAKALVSHLPKLDLDHPLDSLRANDTSSIMKLKFTSAPSTTGTPIPITSMAHGSSNSLRNSLELDLSQGQLAQSLAASSAAAAGVLLSGAPVCSIKLDAVSERRRREAWAVYGERWAAKTRRIQRESPHGSRKGWALRCLIVKSGDDGRQEQMALQLIRTFQEIFTEAGLPLWVRYYDVLVTSSTTALIEVVPDALSIHTVKHRSPPGSSLSDHFFARWPKGTPECVAAQRKFTESLAAYSIICYLLQIKDRHNGNVLIDDEGHLVHIDFGFMLSNSPGGINFEAAPFKLTRELLEVMDSNSEGKPSELFDYFKVLMIQGFLACRKHHERLLLLVKVMSRSGLPCFKAGDRAVKQLEKRLNLPLPEVQIMQVVLTLISDSLDAWRTRQYDYYQRLLNGIL